MQTPHASGPSVTHPSHPAALPRDRTATLDELLARAGEVSDETRELAFIALDDAQRLAYGRAIDTDAVISSTIPFAVGAYAVFASMSADDRAKVMGASTELVDLLVRETAALRDRKAAFDATASEGEVNRAARRAAARKALHDGVVLRDQVHTALRGVTKPEHRDALAKALGTADNAVELAAGMRGVGGRLKARLEGSTPAQRDALARVHLTADLVTALDDGADHALTTEKAAQGNAAQARVTQRELDLGDGSVVHLVGILYRAFREATAALPTLVVPPLGDLARFFDRPAAKPSPAAPPQPAPVA